MITSQLKLMVGETGRFSEPIRRHNRHLSGVVGLYGLRVRSVRFNTNDFHLHQNAECKWLWYERNSQERSFIR